MLRDICAHAFFISINVRGPWRKLYGADGKQIAHRLLRFLRKNKQVDFVILQKSEQNSGERMSGETSVR